MATVDVLRTGEVYILLSSRENEIVNELTRVLRPNLKTRAKIIIDLEPVKKIGSHEFGILQELMQEAQRTGSEVVFTNMNEEISELIGSLTLTDES